jgi:hypothetical protein
MNSSAIETAPSSPWDRSRLNVVWRGFPHPQLQSASNGDQRGAHIPEVQGRACTWDAITDED